MDPTIKQRLAIFHGLRLRAELTPTEFRQMAGVDQPIQALRFTVIPRGNNTFEIVERATGKTKGERFGHHNACQFAQQLEDHTKGHHGRYSTVKLFGKLLLRWALALTALLSIFAFYGTDR